MLNPFDLRTLVLAKHAQHVVLIHFPIALYLSATLFDLAGRIFQKRGLSEVAGWNILAAAATSLPAAATGLLAWRWALEGQAIKGILRLHLFFAIAAVAGIWITWWLRSRVRRRSDQPAEAGILLLEFAVSILIAVAGHLGGFLSGVNGGP